MYILPSHESLSTMWLSFSCFLILSLSSFLMYSMIPDQPPRAWIQQIALSFIPSFTTVFGIVWISSERPFFAKSEATEAAKHIRLCLAQILESSKWVLDDFRAYPYNHKPVDPFRCEKIFAKILNHQSDCFVICKINTRIIVKSLKDAKNRTEVAWKFQRKGKDSSSQTRCPFLQSRSCILGIQKDACL